MPDPASAASAIELVIFDCDGVLIDSERIFSAKQVARSKPAPDVYLFAASTLGVSPSKCLVIEDSPAGVAAGVGAGMKVMGFCANTPAHRLREAGAHPLFDDMRNLPGLISREGAGNIISTQNPVGEVFP